VSIRIASDEKSTYQAAAREHAQRVADGLRRLPADEQIAHVREWLDRARAVRRAVQTAEREVNARARNRTRASENMRDELIVEAARRAAESNADIERGIAAAREHLKISETRTLPAHVITGSAMWVAAVTALPALATWPFANAEHMLVSAGMYAFGSKVFLPQPVAVLALAKLGHANTAIGRELDIDRADVRGIVRDYTANP
jgi:hypothetical protein